MTSSPVDVQVVGDRTDLARKAAELFVDASQEAIADHGRFRVALAGGSTPRDLYRLLADPEHRGWVTWSHVECYFGDERCVPSDHPESNFRMVQETLFTPLALSSDQIFRMPGELEPSAGADAYEAVLRKQFEIPAPVWPRFDLVLLGLGEDGHTASLFPDTPALDERMRLVVPGRAPQGVEGVKDRLTLTVPTINHARMILVLVSGRNKAKAVQAVLDDPGEPLDPRWPARLIHPVFGRLVWLIDREANSLRQP